MKGKKFFLLFLVLVLVMPFVYAQNDSKFDENVKPDITSKYQQQITPYPVRRALMDFADMQRTENKLEEGFFDTFMDRKFAKIISNSLAVLLAFLILVVFIRAKKTHKIKRVLRRQVIYVLIILMGKRGLSRKKIFKKLIAKGWQKRHVGDAIYRYKEMRDI